MEHTSAIEIGKLIKEYRNLAGYTQFELAEIINIDDRQMSKIERGVHYPSVPTFLKLIKILQIDITKLSGEILPEKMSAGRTKLLRFARTSDENKIKLANQIIDLIEQAQGN